MSDIIIDEIEKESDGILNQKHHRQSRIIFCLFISFLLFYVVVMTGYSSLDLSGTLNYTLKVLFFGFLLYYNIIHFKQERVFEKSPSQFPKWLTIIFLLFMGFMLLFSVKQFVQIISTDWLRFPTLVFFSIIVSIIIICLKEIKYLRKV